jgi:hypothetical protein
VYIQNLKTGFQSLTLGKQIVSMQWHTEHREKSTTPSKALGYPFSQAVHGLIPSGKRTLVEVCNQASHEAEPGQFNWTSLKAKNSAFKVRQAMICLFFFLQLSCHID